MDQKIYVLDDGGYELVLKVRHLFIPHRNEIEVIRKTSEDLQDILKNAPTLLIINEDLLLYDLGEIINVIKSDDESSTLPIIVVSSNSSKKHRIDIMKLDVQNYIRTPIEEEYLYFAVRNLLNLLKINRRVSPLTGLPGNIQIQSELKKRLLNSEIFAILYLDLDNFKAYNDVYGFSKGDEIIKFTSDVITSSILGNTNIYDSFVGHIGGDDFIALIAETNYDEICKEILEKFENNVLSFFTKEDAEKGYLEVLNRKGKLEKFPITSLSIGVVEITPKKFKNILEIGEAGAQVKKKAKQMPGNSYFIDRRAEY